MVDIFSGKEEEAKKSLEKLRGSNHMEIIDAELFRISATLQMVKWEQGYSKGTLIYFISSRCLSRHISGFYI